MVKKLRSYDWFGKSDKMGFVHRSWLRNQGYPDDYFQGKPVIGICNTWSELTPCNGHLRDFAELRKRGYKRFTLNKTTTITKYFIKNESL